MAVWVLGSTLIVASIGVCHQVRPYSACLLAAQCRSLWQLLEPLLPRFQPLIGSRQCCAGDAKCVLARQRDDSSDQDGANLKAVTLTQEHKAIMAFEKARIERAGGHVSSNGRLAGAALLHCAATCHR